MVVALTTAGDQVPVTPFGEVAASTGTGSPPHIASVVGKSGVISVPTFTCKVKGAAHWPVFGVKRYDPFVVVSIAEGDQVPVTPFGEVVASTGGIDPWHKVSGDVKLGVVAGVTFTWSVNGEAHCPVVGVKT